MKLAVFSLTKEGFKTARKLNKTKFSTNHNLTYFLPERQQVSATDLNIEYFNYGFKETVGQAFQDYQGLIFIMATGIVIRVIADFIEDKKTDPAILALDDKGENVISLLSGHLGGANSLTRELAKDISANPVITTSSDLHQIPALEVYARENNYLVDNFAAIKYVTRALIEKEAVALYSKEKISFQAPTLYEISDFKSKKIRPPSCYFPHKNLNWQARIIISNRKLTLTDDLPTVILRPQNLVLGLGFTSSKKTAELEAALSLAAELAGVSLKSLITITTSSIKQEAAALNFLAQKLDLEIKYFTKQEIERVSDQLPDSKVARNKLDLAGVSEHTALLKASRGKWLLRKAEFLEAVKNNNSQPGEYDISGITVALREEV